MYSRDPDWSAKRKSEIVINERRSESRCWAQVARPCIGIHRRISQILIRRTVKILGAALGHNTYLTARSPAVFRLVASGHYLHLLRGIYAGNADDGAAAAGADSWCAVKCDQRVLRARSVDLKGNPATDSKVEIPKR